MNEERQESVGTRFIASHDEVKLLQSSCELDAEGHCVTCSDEALEARVVSIDQETGLALVIVEDATEEIDVTLVDSIVPGDLLLVHGGVAIGRL